VRILEAATGRALVIRRGQLDPRDEVVGVASSTDGAHLVVIGNDAVARRLACEVCARFDDVPPLAEIRLTRPVTREERRASLGKTADCPAPTQEHQHHRGGEPCSLRSAEHGRRSGAEADRSSLIQRGCLSGLPDYPIPSDDHDEQALHE
jgi:hypothetical protein